jgi:hypothetical protein
MRKFPFSKSKPPHGVPIPENADRSHQATSTPDLGSRTHRSCVFLTDIDYTFLSDNEN